MDTPAAIAAFMNGEGGIYPTGTWMIGSFAKEAETPGRPLYKNYAVFPYPRLWGQHVEFVSGHAWVVRRAAAAPEQRKRSRVFFKFHGRAQFRLGADRPHPSVQGGARRPPIPCLAVSRRHRAFGSIGRPLPATCCAKMRSRAWSARKPPRLSPARKRFQRALPMRIGE